MASIADSVKRIQIDEEGTIILGTPAMVGFLNQLAIAEIDPKKIFNLSKEGLIIEIRVFPKEMSTDLRLMATCFFLNQVSVRNIIDHQQISNLLKNE